jgi:hypothetical protein
LILLLTLWKGRSILTLDPDFFESFFANVTIDEKGRAGSSGSSFVPFSDGRTLRRSTRIRRQGATFRWCWIQGAYYMCERGLLFQISVYRRLLLVIFTR